MFVHEQGRGAGGEAGSDLWGKIGICGRKISEARLCFGLKLGEETYLEISEVQWDTITLQSGVTKAFGRRRRLFTGWLELFSGLFSE